jgi:predicted ester cyclase
LKVLSTKFKRWIKEKRMAQDNAAIVRGFADEVITKGNIEAAAEYVWENVVEQVPLPGQGPGLDGLKGIIRAMRRGFPDVVFSIQEQITEGDKVASRFEWTGTHKGEFLGIPATGRPVRVWGMVIDRLGDGRIKDTRLIMDTLGLMVQLGVVSLPAAP